MVQRPDISKTPLARLKVDQCLSSMAESLPGMKVAWYLADHGKPCHDSLILLNDSDKEQAATLLGATTNLSDNGKWLNRTCQVGDLWTQICSEDLTDQHSSCTLLWQPEGFTLDETQKKQVEYLNTILGFLHHQKATSQQLEEIQKHMRYMVIWSESLEWIKGLQEEDRTFYEELLTRSMLLTDAEGGALHLLRSSANDHPENSPWLRNRIELPLLQALEASLEKSGTPVTSLKKNVEFDASSDKSESPIPGKHVMVIPVSDLKNVEIAILILTKSAKKPAFTLTDQVYLNLLLSQVYSGLEKNSLLRELDAKNHSLREEKAEQQVLIQKLQDAQEQLLQSEKLASIGQLAAGVAHEINNPVGFINSNLGTLGEYCNSLLTAVKDMVSQVEKTSDKDLIADFKQIATNNEFDFIEDDLPELIEESKEGIKRVTTIVQDLKDFSRTDPGKLELVDIQSILDKTLNIVHNEIKYKAEVVKNYGNVPPVEVVESQIGQVVLNILVNAAHAMKEKGTITIQTKLATDPDFIIVDISDTGCGIPEENIPNLFDPFFTTKPVGQGTGLGLSLSYGIIKRHHGEISVTSEIDKGTTFSIRIPVKQPETHSENGQT